MDKQLQQIIGFTRRIKGYSPLHLHQPVTFKVSPHIPPVEVHGVQVSPKQDLYLMDGNGEWHQLEESDRNYDMVVASLYQRFATTFGAAFKKEVADHVY